ncbi:MAG: hypothetical protein IT558_00710 [Alphaproteobacteria bacterium]|nr:hypothetical protein [Alphaproteobacteria bacterium]
MANVTATRKDGPGGSFYLVWNLTQANDVALPIDFVGAADRTVRVTGDLDGGSLQIVGALDPAAIIDDADYGLVNDNFENPLEYSGALDGKNRSVTEITSKIRPKATGLGPAAAVKIEILVRSTNR